MSEYIERGALLKAFGCENAVKYGNKNAEQQHKSYSSMMLYEIADEIYDAPAADVEPVVRGEIVKKEMYFEEVGMKLPYDACSICGKQVLSRYQKRCHECYAHFDIERSGSGE